MDRRGAFRGGFGSYSFGSFGGSSDSRISNGSLDRSWTRSRFVALSGIFYTGWLCEI
uniref:Uncharacterized protein n=1 Tax=Parascaris equorum TaxID=6256 RepID=A0A914SD18_PAREQ